MKKKRTGLSIIIGGLVIVVLLAAYTSYKSYTNIGVGGDDPKVETTNKTTMNNHHKKNISNKKNSNIFLQDAQHPDRILAINPNGANGVYLYRMQSDGTIYPEYQYFNGQTKVSKKSISVIPNSTNNAQTLTFTNSLDTNGKGEYRDTKSGKTYNALFLTNFSDGLLSKAISKTKDPFYLTVKKRANESNLDFLLRASKYRPNPSSTDNQMSGYSIYQHHYEKLINGNYYDSMQKKIYGNNPNSISLSQFYKNPSRYVDKTFDITKDVMYYKQNRQCDVTYDSINENMQWSEVNNGDKFQQKLAPKFYDLNAKKNSTNSSDNSEQIGSANAVSQFVDNNVE